MDETTVSLHPPLRRCWMRRGQRKHIPAPGSPRYRHVFGALNWRTQQVDWISAQRKNTDSFIAFIEHLLTVCYPTQRLVLVLDNASYHKSYAALAALSLFQERLQVIWLPTYSPYLNPIERFWLQLKNQASANQLHLDLWTLDAAITQAVDNQNTPGHPSRLELKDHFQLVA
jgi:putative transposase